MKNRSGWCLALFTLSICASLPAWSASWWHCDWRFRTELALTSTEATGEITVHIDLASTDFEPGYQFTPEGNDVRVIDSDDNTELDFVLEQWVPASRTAIINIKAPALSTAPRSVYLYYGNTLPNGSSAVATTSSFSGTFTESGWRIHARSSTVDPSSEQQARAVFAGIEDGLASTGCTIRDALTGRNKRNTFGGAGTDFALFNEAFFETDVAGSWSFRFGGDYGRGGGLYVNDTVIEEDWQTDLWWNNSFNNADVLTGSINLPVGVHHIEAIGFEGCCDGAMRVQFRRPGSTVWLDMIAANIPILSRSCPVGEQTSTFAEVRKPVYFAGHVFLDNGIGGVAHDGNVGTGETGVSGITVTSTVVSTGSTRTDQSDANGNWSVCYLSETDNQVMDVSAVIPSARYIVSEGLGPSNTDPDPDAHIVFTALPGTEYDAVNIGLIDKPQLTSDQNISVAAGATGLLAHQYTASSSGELIVQISELEHNKPFSFSYSVFRDTDCDGTMDASATPLPSPIPVQANDQVCLLLEVKGGSIVVESSLLKLRIEAYSTFANITLEDNRTNTDQVQGVLPVQLQLIKQVCNASLSSCDLLSGAGFSNNNIGTPDQELVYRLTFSSAQSQFNDLRVYDAVPPYTTLKPDSISVVKSPPSVVCSIIQPPNQSATGYTGTVEWRCNGSGEPPSEGILGFSVLVE